MLAALAAALVAAFVLAPARLAADGGSGDLVDHRHLVEGVHGAFVQYWRSGDRDLTPDLARIVDYWFRYHVVKGAIAAALLIVLVALTVLVWKMFLRAEGRGTAEGLGTVARAALASAGTFATMLAMVALAAVMANIQGMKAPFASLLPMLTEGATDPELATALDQATQALADPARTGARTPPAIDVMSDDFARYHVALAVVAAIAATALLGTSVLLWRRFARAASADRRTRRVLGSFGVLSAVLTLGLLVLMVGNINAAGHSPRVLLDALRGGL
ncbi:hypothetical protein BL253_02455 [Pseudofrankia asymbiotica]|uniref:Tat (Twin-arginine translocation) pathway signal sequence n=1 Tax=Pseudofrankia asymbiotica TaxID=1834516 RepID=A0A1V2IJA5_9ACTN|nr:hypothetical protein BL253_02455 [Pseudofrankia asymbiotica]